jgi:hypothetical protein
VDLTVDTPRGDVDLVAVERVLAGTPCRLTEAETSYALTRLLRALRDKPAADSWVVGASGGFRHEGDVRITLAALGFGNERKALIARLDKHRERYGYETAPERKTREKRAG